MSRIKEQNDLLTVPVKIRINETYQFAAGSVNASVTRFAERLENSEGLLTAILTVKLTGRKPHVK